MKTSQAAKKVIALAKAIHHYWDTELPKRHPDYPLVHAGEDSGPPPPEEKKLKELLGSLPPDIIYKLVLIMYVGRGDFGTDDLPEQYKALKTTFAKPAAAAAQMMQKGLLEDYLADGLAELEKSGIDLDDLTFTSVKSAAASRASGAHPHEQPQPSQPRS